MVAQLSLRLAQRNQVLGERRVIGTPLGNQQIGLLLIASDGEIELGYRQLTGARVDERCGGRRSNWLLQQRQRVGGFLGIQRLGRENDAETYVLSIEGRCEYYE